MENKIKAEQLGMPIGTASNILRKSVLFEILCRHNENICYQCGQIIEKVSELSIEHKVPWLHSENPKELFFSINNIAFSHLNCNVGARRKLSAEHGTTTRYNAYGCRCDGCKKAHNYANKKNRNKYKGMFNSKEE